MTTKQLKSYLLALLSALVLPNLYAAPSDGPYVLDEQRFYVAGQVLFGQHATRCVRQ